MTRMQFQATISIRMHVDILYLRAFEVNVQSILIFIFVSPALLVYKLIYLGLCVFYFPALLFFGSLHISISMIHLVVIQHFVIDMILL